MIEKPWLERRRNQWWVCNKKSKGKPKCNNFKFSIKKGTFFDNTQLGIYQVLLLVWHFVHNNNTAVDWFLFGREVCDNWMKKKSEKLGGPGGVVEIDESYMCTWKFKEK